MLAPRGYSLEEINQLQSNISESGNKALAVAKSEQSEANAFASRNLVTEVERKVAPALKAMFKVSK